MNEDIIIRKLDGIQRQLDRLLAEKRKPKALGKAGDVLRLTGWSKEILRQRRDQGLIDFQRTDKGIVYDLNSIPQQLIHYENKPMPSAGSDRVDDAGDQKKLKSKYEGYLH